ncbi:MAG: dicarboxylate/amino acid:cation symporter [Clostridiales bacterium]|nr:dicarboxylate/amino acid:cation symporter [Clostridiales bacterium]
MEAAESLPVRLLPGIVIGISAGLVLPEQAMVIVVTIKYFLNQLINYCVPLIIVGFIAPSITKLGKNATKLLAVAVIAECRPRLYGQETVSPVSGTQTRQCGCAGSDRGSSISRPCGVHSRRRNSAPMA